MFGKSVEILIRTAMANHVYRFENKIRKQSEGGPIGLGLTGEVADWVMIDWEKKFLEALKQVNINPKVYFRFN